jgi:hypothetical protein
MQPIMTKAALRKMQHNEHAKDYYNLPNQGPGKFEGERQAVRIAYDVSLDGCCEDFGDADFGYYCQVNFEEYPGTVYFWENSQGFVTEIDKNQYLAARHDY